MTKDLQKKVEDALEEIRPYLQADNGDIELVEIQGNKVTVRLLGACLGCTVNQMTLKSGVEMTIKKHAPEITEVINIQ